jgi:hypothetical protein
MIPALRCRIKEQNEWQKAAQRPLSQRGGRDELKYLQQKQPGVAPEKAPVGGMSELDCQRGER